MTVAPLTTARFDDFIDLIRALADYERLAPPDAAAIERLRHDGLAQPRFEAALAFNEAGTAVGYATWFHTYSTFLAKPTIYLEDLFVREDARESGAGSALFEHVRT